MAIFIQQILKVLRLLHSPNGHRHLAISLTFGLFLGLSPFLSLQTLLVLFVIFILNINFALAFTSAFFFKFVAYLLDPAADLLGRWALELEPLRPLWTKLYNMPIVPYTRFNNSIAMGSFIVALLLAPIFYWFFKKMIQQYRLQIAARLEKTTWFKAIQKTKYYDYYQKYNDYFGEQ